MKRALVIRASSLVLLAVVVFASVVWTRSRASHRAHSAPPAASLADDSTEGQPSGNGASTSSEAPSGTPGVAREDRGTLRLEGQVIDEDELAVSGAVVTIATVPPRVVITQGGGIFTFEHLAERVYRVVARAGDRTAGPVAVRVTPTVEALTLRMHAGASVRIAVVDAATRRPLAGATIALADLGEPAHRTDEAGVAVLRGLPSGRYDATVAHAGYAPVTVTLATGRGGSSTSRDVALQQGAAVAGVVVDAQGRPAGRARVHLASMAPSAPAVSSGESLTTASDGTFTFAAVAAGRVDVVAEHDELGVGRSGSIALDGIVPVHGLEIRLDAGVSLHGHVVTRAGTPVAFASVRATATGGGTGMYGARRAQSDERGEFRIAGLPRRAVQVVAVHETASSAITAVDLSSEDRDVRLVVDSDGSIDGVVVTAAGEPVPDAQVAATPEANPQARGAVDRTLLGMSTAVTDQDGRFSLTGLAPGAYRIWGSRTDAMESNAFWMHSGTVAAVGTKDVRIVLLADGSVRGHVAFVDGALPAAFMVAVAQGQAAPFGSGDGTFVVHDAPSGTQTVTVSGPGIEPKFVDGVTILGGQEVDVGTIRVARTRSVRGRVVHPDGSPVAGATVFVSASLVAGGGTLIGHEDENPAAGRQEGTSDADGQFVVDDVGKVPLFAIAERAGDGRSLAQPISPKDDAPSVQLVLQPTAVLQGVVTRAGVPVPAAAVVATQPAANRERFAVSTDPAGHYQFDSLAAGPYVVTAMLTVDALRSTQASKNVTLAPQANQELDLDVGNGKVDVTVTLIDRASQQPVPNAQAYLLSGQVAATRAGELETAIAARGDGATYVTHATQSQPARFEGVSAGSYTLCVVGIFADLSKPAMVQRVQRQAAQLPVACVPFTVKDSSGAEQQSTVLLP